LPLLIPGVVWYGVTEGSRCYKEMRDLNPETPIGRRIPVLYSLSVFAVAVVLASRFSGLIIVAGFFWVDLWSWFRRKKHRTVTGPGIQI
jgi:hypothetical protein